MTTERVYIDEDTAYKALWDYFMLGQVVLEIPKSGKVEVVHPSKVMGSTK